MDSLPHSFHKNAHFACNQTNAGISVSPELFVDILDEFVCPDGSKGMFRLSYWPVSLEVECQTQVQKVWDSHPSRVLAETINLSISLLLCEALHNKR